MARVIQKQTKRTREGSPRKRLGTRQLKALIEEAIIDAYGESEACVASAFVCSRSAVNDSTCPRNHGSRGLATQMLKRIAEAQLYEVDVRNPATLVVAAVTVLSAALLAAYLPARRASRTDPATVLRAE